MKGSLPDSIAWRKNKIGFESPENIWLSDVAYFMNTINQSNLLQKIYNHNIPQNLTQHMLWKLFNIAKWEHIFNVEL
jgi:asparagine synthase (glutamine-hydrolysing)